MTANNIITTDEGVALFSDRASYDEEGVIRDFVSKSYVNEQNLWGALFCGSTSVAQTLRRSIPDDVDFDMACRILPYALKAEYDARVATFGDLAHSIIRLAGYSREEGTWSAGRIASCPGYAKDVFAFERVPCMFAPPIPLPGAGRELSFAEIDHNFVELGAQEFARRVLTAQRLVDCDKSADGRPRRIAVAGAGELVIITAKGVRRHTVATWPDRLGEDPVVRNARIAAEPQPTFLTLTRAERRRLARAA